LGLSVPEPLTAAHDVSLFSCGKPALDHWLRTRALSNQEKGFTAVIVVHEDSRVVGYYGLAPTAVVPSVLPRSIRTGQPPDPVLCLLLGQLATDRAWGGKGIGTGLLKHALSRCVTAAHLIGGRALVAKAIDSEAAAFWSRRGFLPSKDDPLVLFRSMADIATALEKAGTRSAPASADICGMNFSVAVAPCKSSAAGAYQGRQTPTGQLALPPFSSRTK
jgi:GNAT superfamily N-acetyltransferase